MKYILLAVFIAVWPSTIFAADDAAKTTDTHKILLELRGMDSSTDSKGDHVVGEQLC